MASVGILGARTSAEIHRVRQELLRQNARVVVIDLSGFPAVHRASLSLSALRVGSTELLEVPVWLHRQLELDRRLSAELRAEERGSLGDEIVEAMLVDREVRSFVESLLWSLVDAQPPIRLVNPPPAAALHQRKPLLGARLLQAGVPVPRSLTTTHRETARAFVEQCNGQAVCKAAAGYGRVRLASEVLSELPAGQTSLDGPFVFQQRILGRSLRAYVVGEAVVGCCEVVHGDVVDWRTDQRALRPVTLTAELEALLQRACRAAGLDYASIDLELDRAGRPFVLDVSPTPLFAAFERDGQVNVAGPLAAHLIALCEAS
jgi:glutathione synthase/RimK-type ligase-like ATP-grasp enzyme